jgi:hypothetical protein
LRAFRVSVLAFVACGVAAAGVMAAIIPNANIITIVTRASVVGALAALFAHARASASPDGEDLTLTESTIALLAGVAPAAVVVAAALIVLLAVVGYQPLWATREVPLDEAARNGDIAEVSRLVKGGADADTALEAGVESRQVEVLQVLVNAGATADESRRQRLACLAVAVTAPEVGDYLRSTLPPAAQPDCTKR